MMTTSLPFKYHIQASVLILEKFVRVSNDEGCALLHECRMPGSMKVLTNLILVIQVSEL
jgi:hypothetical protein